MYIAPYLEKTSQTLVYTKMINMYAAEWLNDFFDYGPIAKGEYVEELMNKNNITNKDAVLICVRELITSLETEKYLETKEYKLLEEYLFGGLTEEDIDKYLNNPYVQTVKVNNESEGNYHLLMEKYEPYQIWPKDDIKVNPDAYGEISQIGYFTTDFYYLALYEGNNIWMSLNPNEINTMQPHINEAKGRVLVLGLGLGYYPFMISLKDEVSEIVIIEKEPQIIKLFNEHLLPLFPHKEKITIVEDDAFNYLEKHKKDQGFDTVFCDIWHSTEEGTPLFTKLIKYENDYGLKFQYWLETSLLAMVRRCLIQIILDYYDNYSDKDYQNADNDIDQLINDLYFKVKGNKFTTSDELYRFLSDDNIREILKR